MMCFSLTPSGKSSNPVGDMLSNQMTGCQNVVLPLFNVDSLGAPTIIKRSSSGGSSVHVFSGRIASSHTSPVRSGHAVLILLLTLMTIHGISVDVPSRSIQEITSRLNMILCSVDEQYSTHRRGLGVWWIHCCHTR